MAESSDQDIPVTTALSVLDELSVHPGEVIPGKELLAGLSSRTIQLLCHGALDYMLKEARQNPILSQIIKDTKIGERNHANDFSVMKYAYLGTRRQLGALLEMRKGHEFDPALLEAIPSSGVTLLQTAAREGVRFMLHQMNINVDNVRERAMHSGKITRGLEIFDSAEGFPDEDEVFGLDEAKSVLQTEMLKLQHPGVIKSASSHVLLVGRPGTGKTFLVKMLAKKIMQMSEKMENKIRFAVITLADLYEHLVGLANNNLDALLRSLDNAAPLIGLFDEVDTGTQGREDHLQSETQKVIGKLLSWMDGIIKRKSNMLFIGTTNRPDLMDSAFLRPGRFERHVLMPEVDADTLTRMLRHKAEKTLSVPFTVSDTLLASFIQKHADPSHPAERWTGANADALVRRLDEDHLLRTVGQKEPRSIDDAVFAEIAGIPAAATVKTDEK